MARRRLLLPLLAGIAGLAVPGAARAAPVPASSAGGAPIVRLAAPAPTAGTLTGSIVALAGDAVTVRTGATRMSVPGALVAAANAVTAGAYPYVWGGGHPAAGTPSLGLTAAGHGRARAVGYDCSGSVAAVLAGAGLWPAGTGVPSDSGLIAELRQAGVLARGAGVGAGAVTLWDDPGVHVFMSIGARFFGTSDGLGGSPLNPNAGAGWLDDGAPDTTSGGYQPWHVVPAALTGSVLYGPTTTVSLGALAPTPLLVGQRVSVRWRTVAGAALAAAVTVD